jgi:hypothetical protein
MADELAEIIVFYGPVKEIGEDLRNGVNASGIYPQYKLSPSPFINISTSINYANDNIVGYKYSVDMEGTVVPSGDVPISIANTSKNISEHRKKLTTYGSYLFVYDNTNKTVLLEGQNGLLQSLAYNESNNNWLKSVPYRATIEFQELIFDGENTDKCSSGDIGADSLSKNLIDRDKYKIKSFNDQWSISADAETLYSDIKFLDTSVNGFRPDFLKTDNLTYNVRYTIDSEGMNYSKWDGTENLIVPAWEQAKSFCQDRLFTEVKKLAENICYINANTACEATSTLANLYGISDEGLIFEANKFKIYNESVRCETSEGAGSFSAEYSAILKIERPTVNGFSNEAVRHTFTKNVQTEKNGIQKSATNEILENKVITIEGEIQGLVEGGLLFAQKSDYELPQTGYLIVQRTSQNEKYNNALLFAQKFFDNQNIEKAKDIHENYKGQYEFGLRPEDFMQNTAGLTDIEYAKPETFNISKDYSNGVISYSAKYSTGKTGGRHKYSNTSIEIQRGVPVVATFQLPNGGYITESNPNGVGVIIQDMGTKTRDVMNITIEGNDPDSKLGYINIEDPNSYLKVYNFLASSSGNFNLPTDISYPSGSVLTERTKTTNILTGSYSIKLAYILCTPGCPIPPPTEATGYIE